MLQRLLILFTILLLIAAFGIDKSDLVIQNAWTRSTMTGSKNAAIYLEITNNSNESDILKSAKTDIASTTEFHKTEETSTGLSMKEIDKVEILAGGTVKFELNGLHVMLKNLKENLTEGKRFNLELNFEKAGTITIEVKVTDHLGQ